MVDILAAKGRKLVIIIDPHIKLDPEYKIYKDGMEKGLFLQSKYGGTFVGKSARVILKLFKPNGWLECKDLKLLQNVNFCK